MNELAIYAAEQEQAAPAETHAARRACVAQMLKSLHAGFNLPLPDPHEFGDKISAFAQTLQDVPLEDFPPLTALMLRDLPTGFMPSAGQAFGFWQRTSGQAPVNAPNAGAYQRYEPKVTDKVFALNANSGAKGAKEQRMNRERFNGGQLAVTCNCVMLQTKDGYRYFKTAVLSPDEKHWVCFEGECNFILPINATKDAPSKGKPHPLMAEAVEAVPAPEVREDNNTLLAALDERADIMVEALPQVAALSFARHLRDICHSSQWTPQLAREEWPLWMDLQGAALFPAEVAA